MHDITNKKQIPIGVLEYAKRFTKYPIRISRIEILNHIGMIGWKRLPSGKFKVVEVVKKAKQ